MKKKIWVNDVEEMHKLMQILSAHGYQWVSGAHATAIPTLLQYPVAVVLHSQKTITWSCFSVYDNAEEQAAYIASCVPAQDVIDGKVCVWE